MNISEILLYIVSFIVMMSIIVIVHEWGHFFTARKFDVYCGEFSIGMGPLIWKKQGKETQYSLRALPIGGYVSMAGEVDDTKKDTEVPYERTIPGLIWWKKILVMLAGIFMNVVLAWVIFISVFAIQGYAVVQKDNYTIGGFTENSVAEAAGFKTGDVITKIVFANGEVFKIDNGDDLSTAIAFNPKEVATFTVKRDGETLQIKATPKYNKDTESYLLGVTSKVYTKKINAVQAIGYGTKELGDNAQLIFTSLGRILQGKNLNQLSGPVGIVKISGKAASNGFMTWLRLLAILSVNVGIFNLLPLPILDGGRALITLIERIFKRTLNERVMEVIMYIGVFALVILLAFATFNDIGRLF